jgi:hypothetical protein
MLLSGLALVQGEWNDARFNNFVLEHGYRWLLRAPPDTRFWDVPAFFPVPNAAAYSDVLLSVAPPYWLLRAAGAAPDTAFELWLLTMATLNFGASYVLLRRALRASAAAASLGAFVFAFGAPRGAQVYHAQLVPQLYTVVALYALWRLFDEAGERATTRDGDRRDERRWIALFFAGAVAQLYAAFYHSWFLGFSLLVAALWALVLPAPRAALLGVARRRAWTIAGCTAASALLAWPMAAHYLRAAHDVGLRDFSTVEPMLPRPASWLYMGPGNWLYRRLAGLAAFRAIPAEHEQRLGLGFATAVVALGGLWGARRRAPARLMLLTAATLIVLATLWAPGLSLWPAVYGVVPGAAALRAVSRIGMMLLVPASFGVALAAQRVRELAAARPALALPLLALPVAAAIVAEQGQDMDWYDRTAARARASAVARAIPARCAAFLYTPLAPNGDPWWYHGDAMWAALERGVPTVNGYSGNVPRGWPFYDVIARSPAEDSLLAHALTAWEARWRLAPATVCRVRLVDADPAARTR